MKQQGCVGRSFVVAAGQATVDVKKEKKWATKRGKMKQIIQKKKWILIPRQKILFFRRNFRKYFILKKALTQSDTKLPNIYQNVEFKENEKDLSFEMTIHRTAFEAFLYNLPIDGVKLSCFMTRLAVLKCRLFSFNRHINTVGCSINAFVIIQQKALPSAQECVITHIKYCLK